MSKTNETSTREVADLAARLRLALTRTTRRLRQEAGTDLTPSQFSALNSVDCHGPLTPSELAERERIQRPSATRVVARLIDEGLVERTADPADARSALLSVSAKGTTLIAASRRRRNAYLAKRLRGLDEPDLDTLERAADVLEQMLEGERP
jgi:DNA-binding MarR family transcriptional regulator